MATTIWLLALWAWADIGRPVRRSDSVEAPRPPRVSTQRELEVV
jgi:hypothetical protein